MRRINPGVRQRLHAPESENLARHEGHAGGLRPEWAFRGSWDFWVVRAIFVACTGAASYTLSPFGLHGIAAAGAGFLVALVVLLAELRLRSAALSGLVGGAFGAILGVFAALLAFGYLGLVLGASGGEQLDKDALDGLFGKKAALTESIKLLDTSVLIDGRIADICDAQFMEGVLGVPQFVLRELQMVADSSDPLKRQRGRRGLEVLQKIQKMPQVEVRILEDDFPQAGDVDHKLVELARRTGAKIVTNDFNLNKVATVQGFSVLNVNKKEKEMKPDMLNGEK